MVTWTTVVAVEREVDGFKIKFRRGIEGLDSHVFSVSCLFL